MSGPSPRSQPSGLSPMDGLLVLMVIAWGANYSLLKRAFEEIAPAAFNALRMASRRWCSLSPSGSPAPTGRPFRGRPSSVFYTPHALTSRDRWDLLWLGVVGHCLYQLFFAGGLARTSASNAALIFGASPVAVALMTAAIGHERVGLLHWLGAVLSTAGIYFVVGHGAATGGGTLFGDLLMLGAVACWSIYTIGGGRLMSRHSPLFVTGMTMAIGTVPYALLAIPTALQVGLVRRQRDRLAVVVPLGPVRAELCLPRLVHGRPEAWPGSHVHLLERRPARRDDHRRDLPRRTNHRDQAGWCGGRAGGSRVDKVPGAPE